MTSPYRKNLQQNTPFPPLGFSNPTVLITITLVVEQDKQLIMASDIKIEFKN
jgi:hypothetical protein